jgi:V-type H+-transporting ATPase 16kDa proteolipid subunit
VSIIQRVRLALALSSSTMYVANSLVDLPASYKSGYNLTSILNPGIIKNIVPIVMAGVLGIYGLIVSVIIAQAISPPNADKTTSYSAFNGYAHLAAGLCCGLSCLAAGGTIGIIGDVGVQSFGIKAAAGRRFWDGADPAADLDPDPAAKDNKSAEDANKLYVGLLIMLIFAEALALYGLIVALILSQKSYYCKQS